MQVIKRNGKTEEVKLEKIVKRIQVLSRGLKHLDAMSIATKVIAGLYENVTTKELDELAIKTAASMATVHYDYDSLAARLTTSVLHKETKMSFVEVMEDLFNRKDSFGTDRPAVSEDFMKIVRKHKSVLDSTIVHSRDFDFDYLGLETLKKSYLQRIGGKIVERPQHLWLRVAVGIHGKDIDSAIDTYEKLSKKLFTHATPTLFNAGTAKPQLASCFLVHIHEDSISGIFKSLSDCAKISQLAGGLGMHHHIIRATGSPIYGTNGTSNGLVPMLRVFNAMASYVDQCFEANTCVIMQDHQGNYRCPIINVKPGDLVLSSDGNFHKVLDKKEFEYNGPIVSISGNNQGVSVTPEHLFLCARDVRQFLGTASFSDQIDLDDDLTLLLRNKIKKGAVEVAWVSAKDLTRNDAILYTFKSTFDFFTTGKVPTVENVPILADYYTFNFDEEPLDLPVDVCRFNFIGDLSINDKATTVYDLKIQDVPNYQTVAGIAHNGGGKRKGALASYLEIWHADVFEWLDLKKNTGKDEVRARDLFYGAWVPDLFMKRVEADGEWTLFDPLLSPGLSDCWGETFEKLYTQYEEQGKGVRKVKAQELWRKMLELQVETSMPYMMYKDAVNRKSNQQNLGTIKSSNLCAEVVEFTSPEEIAVCNLGSISLPSFVEGQQKPRFNHKKLCEVVKTSIVNLNRVIDINHYPLPETKRSNMRHRPVGLGVQGLADVFMQMRYSWDSPEAFELNREIFESIYFAAVEASMEEAAKFGAYETFQGSPSSQGKLQFDLWYEERLARGEQLTATSGEELYCTSKRYDWKGLKEKIKQHGLRNSLLLANMPTASTSSILGNTEGFEPIPSNIYKRNVLSGEFIRINKFLIDDLSELNLWNDAMKQRIIAGEGSIQHIQEIPENIRSLYRTVWEIKQKTLIDLAADRGAFVCQSQSLNIFMAQPTIATLSSMHFYGWHKGLKTGSYYIRQQAARQAQKFTVDAEVEKKMQQDSEAQYQQALEVLKARGYEEKDLKELSREDVIATAKVSDNPEECLTCSS